MVRCWIYSSPIINDIIRSGYFTKNVPTRTNIIILFFSSRWDTYRKVTGPNDIVDYWAKVDPTPNKKYLDWLLRQYLKHDFRQEDDVRVHNALENFERYKARLA